MSFGIRVFPAIALSLAIGALSTQAATFGFEALNAPALAGPEADDSIPPEARVLLDKTAAAFASGDFRLSEALARMLTERAPQAGAGWYLLGLSLANQSRMDEALAALDQAAARYARNAQPLLMKGEILRSLDRTDEARAAYAAALERDAASWPAAVALAELAEAAGDRDEAIAQYRAVAQSAPAEEIRPALHLGRLLIAAERPQEAAAVLTPLAASDTAPDTALDLAARAALLSGDNTTAAGFYRRIADRGRILAGHLGLAAVEQAEGHTAEAETWLRRAVEVFPDDAAAHLALGNLYLLSRNDTAALAAFLAGIPLAREKAGLLRAASRVEQHLGQIDAALHHAGELTALPGATAADFLLLGALQEKAGQPLPARGSYARAVALEPENWIALNNLAALSTDSAPEQAVRLAEKALALAPQVATVKDTLGWALYRAGEIARAAEIFQALHDAAPEDPILTYRLGMIRLAEGRKDDGRALIRAALAADPAFKFAEAARAALN